ncbi:D-alanine--poly(phosphoribitol) ligase subunit 1 [Kitasatospora sp. GAS204A]|uniref:amino acid adenylation domain-containing protein n=1 Tax=unclassified Kitasatospora TaxID=2633591 RepID=UPI002476FAF7|nr:amino acid adenylation domain-containing protein [Kitasatospora sp. GAS204B]MDH6121616.1 D-alanine--poly(phosphoribitol) ligase subunit 1 [Kitasatospora sp. GAS204B]
MTADRTRRPAPDASEPLTTAPPSPTALPADPPAANSPAGTVHPLIHEAVARQAEQHPGSTAIVFRADRISYATLNAAADHYAEQLAALGVGAGAIVPVQLPRTPQLAATLLAVLKCGAAYAAFDHRWPTERVDGLLDQLHSPVFVTGNRPAGVQAEATGAGGGRPLTVWQPPAEPLEVSAGAGGTVPPSDIGPDDAACVFFTSGTTGSPKGVVSPHQATTRLFGPDGLRGYRAGGVSPQSAPCAWDAFSLELWGMLVTGGTTVIVEDDYLLPGALRDIVKSAGVDTAFFTSSLFNLFVDMDIDCFAGMGQIYTGGERLSPAHVRRFLAQYPGIALFNAYGPVESCVFATIHELGPEDCETFGGIPIGRPVADTELYVVDGGRLCEPGTEGEICIGGAGLAIGYLEQPELTAEKFAPITVNGTPVRVYRTGDLGFLDADQVLHFRGRADRQVKVRGYRIEPGEIENAAMKVEGVRSCTVVPVPGRTAAWERLALFYTATADTAATAPAEGESDDPIGLARTLGKRLPPYLVPDTVMMVEKFPVTVNGKIDNQALLDSLPA